MRAELAGVRVVDRVLSLPSSRICTEFVNCWAMAYSEVVTSRISGMTRVDSNPQPSAPETAALVTISLESHSSRVPCRNCVPEDGNGASKSGAYKGRAEASVLPHWSV